MREGLCALAAAYIRLVRVSGRWRSEGEAVPEALWRAGRPFILVFWHGRILMMPYCWRRGVPIHMLISQHSDGLFIARTIARFGLGSVAGSSRKGGAAALRTLVRALKRGECVGITPDGPRGPRMRASLGAIETARLSGAPIVPAAFACSRRRVLASWDRFVVARPFARGVFVWGEPIMVAAEADAAARERARRRLEEALNAITARADALVGQPAIEPAPAAEAVAS